MWTCVPLEVLYSALANVIAESLPDAPSVGSDSYSDEDGLTSVWSCSSNESENHGRKIDTGVTGERYGH